LQKEKYHLINAIMHINKVTIKDVNISSNIEQFVKEFVDLQAVSLVNMQSEYNQIKLNKRSCNMTDFMTVLVLQPNCNQLVCSREYAGNRYT